MTRSAKHIHLVPWMYSRPLRFIAPWELPPRVLWLPLSMTSPVECHWRSVCLPLVHNPVIGLYKRTCPAAYIYMENIGDRSIIHLFDLISTSLIGLGNVPRRISNCHSLELMEYFHKRVATYAQQVFWIARWTADIINVMQDPQFWNSRTRTETV